MEADDMIEEHAGELRSIGRFIARDDMAHLGKAVDEYKKGIMTIRDRKVGDKVAGDSFPWTRGYRQRH
jgi:uncharacterized protein YbgA (DUF1722 family)